MNMSGNSILITGGTSGIGFELARQLCQSNTVIITGRDREKLDLCQAKLSTAHIMQSDVSDPDAISALYEKAKSGRGHAWLFLNENQFLDL